uniref:Putative lectin/glucanase superfamily protein n=1 Tax=viral metagenome TaxID=1070528 RepID=A0A6M3LXT8_9ZZZZ
MKNTGIVFEGSTYRNVTPPTGFLYDRSRNKNNGALTAVTYTTLASGVRALTFNGSTSLITVTDAPPIQNIFDGGGSILAWVNPASDGEGNTGRIYQKRPNGWMLIVRNEAAGKMDLVFQQDFDGTVGQWDTTATTLSINTWALVGVTYNNSNEANNPIFYIGDSTGFSVLTMSSGLTETATPVGTRVSDATVDLIVGNLAAVSSTFDGMINAHRLYNYNLTVGQIREIFDAEVADYV